MNTSLWYYEYKKKRKTGTFISKRKIIKKEDYGKLLSAKTAGRYEGRREGGISQDADIHVARL